jgi:YD repeat-containing protein
LKIEENFLYVSYLFRLIDLNEFKLKLITMKLKKLLFTAVLCGMGYSAYPQEPVVPNPLDNLKPWVDDTTSALTKVSVYNEWNRLIENYGSSCTDLDEDCLQGYLITRNPEENSVTLTTQGDRKETWFFSENRDWGWTTSLQKKIDYEMIDFITTKQERTYDTEGNVIKEITLEDSDTLSLYENGKLIYMKGFVKTERNDTIIFSNTDENSSQKCLMYDKNGNLIFCDYTFFNLHYYYDENNLYIETKSYDKDYLSGSNEFYLSSRTICTYNEKKQLIQQKHYFRNRETKELVLEDLNDYTYNEKGLLTKKTTSIWNEEYQTYEEPPTETITYEYDASGRLIRKAVYGSDPNKAESVNDYVYDHNGNLTLQFRYGDKDYYNGWYVKYEYEGGEKKYEPFDPKKYPTDIYPQNSPVANHGKLQVSGKNIVDVNGENVTLRGISTHDIFFFTDSVSPCYNESALDALVDDWGINVLRIASYTELYIKKNAEERRAFIDEMVDMCARKGIYCIIDWHTLNEGTSDPMFAYEEAKEFFEYMSKKHAGKAHVIYEICNEPQEDSWARVKHYAQEMIDVIVKNDPNSIIIVGTPIWSKRVDDAAISQLDYPNAIYSLHYYAASDKEELRQKGDYALSLDCPIIVSEFGTCTSTGNGKIDYNSTIEWFEWMNENNISWINWNFSEKKEASALLKPGSCTEKRWNDVSESGRLIKWALSDTNLTQKDSVLLIYGAITKDKNMKKVDARFDYMGECISENPNFISENETVELIVCAYRKECIAENADYVNDEASLEECVKAKMSSHKEILSELEGVQIYPNLVSDYLTIKYDIADFEVKIFDLNGAIVSQNLFAKGSSEIDMSYLAPGTYLLQVESGGKHQVEKVLKK